MAVSYTHLDVYKRQGHLDYDYGAVVFTEVLDEWLLS